MSQKATSSLAPGSAAARVEVRGSPVERKRKNAGKTASKRKVDGSKPAAQAVPTTGLSEANSGKPPGKRPKKSKKTQKAAKPSAPSVASSAANGPPSWHSSMVDECVKENGFRIPDVLLQWYKEELAPVSLMCLHDMKSSTLESLTKLQAFCIRRAREGRYKVDEDVLVHGLDKSSEYVECKHDECLEFERKEKESDSHDKWVKKMRRKRKGRPLQNDVVELIKTPRGVSRDEFFDWDDTDCLFSPIPAEELISTESAEGASECAVINDRGASTGDGDNNPSPGSEQKEPEDELPVGVAAQQPANKSERRKDPGKDRSRFPAVRNHNHPDKVRYPSITYHIPVSRSWTEAKVAKLGFYHPTSLAAVHRFDRDNEHPLCAAFRSIAEADALKCAINDMAALGIDGLVLDVGGAVKRHHTNGRSYVWSCNPDNTPKDLLRKFSLPEGGHCNCRWQDCSCSGNVISISVHSLYYLAPEEITDRLLRQAIPTHYAVIHVYDNDMGSLMDGEMQYLRRNGMVQVRASGNWQTYTHSDMQWLRAGSWTDGSRTLTWELDRRFMDVCVFKFVAYNGTVSSDLEFDPAGELDSEAAAEEVKFSAVVNECIAPHQSMTAANQRSFMERVVRKGRALGLNVVRLTTYAHKAWLNQPVALVATPWFTPWVASVREARMSMEANWRLWLNFGVRILTPLLLCVIVFNWAMRLYEVLPAASLVNTASSALPSYSSTVFVIVLEVVVAIVLWKLLMHCRRGSYSLPFSLLEIMRAFAMSIALSWKVGAVTGAKVVDYCCDYPDKGVDPRKLQKLRLPRDYAEECVRKDAAYAMVYHPNYAPHFPAGCSHNAVSSLKNKLCQAIPGAGRYSMPLHPVLQSLIPMIRADLQPLSWEEWVSRFPNKKCEKFERDRSNNQQSVIASWNDTGFFTKFEAYSEPKYPRPIGGACVELNFSLGRWLIGIAELLAERLPDHLMFPIHGDADKIGEFFADFKSYKIMDCDFSSFDSSQTEEALELVSSFVEACGVPKLVVDRMRLDQKSIKLTTRKGLKAICKGFRVSGRSETLLGNTLITINTALHVFGESLVAGLFKGDDTVVFLQHGTYDLDMLTKKYLGEGLVAKLRAVDEYEVEFCSSIFIPTSRGYVLSPKPGKILAKTLWCRNLDFNIEKMREQFASILKGMKNAASFIPGFRGLYNHPVYLEYHDRVEAEYSQYSEYSRLGHLSTQDTINYMCNRYQLDAEDFSALSDELSKGFPIRLDSQAARVMIELDWGPSNDGEHLREYCKWSWPVKVDYMVVVVSPAIEELTRLGFPITSSLIFGLVEAVAYGSLVPLIGHALLAWISVRISPWAAFFFHMWWNYDAAGSISFSISHLLVMALKRSRGKKSRQPPSQKTGSNRTKKRNARSNKRGGMIQGHAAMIADPCGSELIPGLYGSDSGMLSRMKSMFGPSEGHHSGYILWDPNGSSLGNRAMSCFYFAKEDWGVNPLNTPGSPFGTGPADLSGITLYDQGANGFVNTEVVDDYRTLSACIRLSYVGNTSECAGRIAYIENLPAKALLGHGVTPPLSVRGAFSLATKVERLPLETSEVTWRPEEATAMVYRGSGVGVFKYEAGGITTISVPSEVATRTFFGFAWDGIPSSKLRFDVVQNIEWRAAPYDGFVSLVPKQVSAPLVTKVLAYLDNRYPGWSTTMARHGANMAAKVAQMALGGSGLVNALQMRGSRQLNVLAYH